MTKITLEKCNKNTLFFDDEINNRFVYLFNYNGIPFKLNEILWSLLWECDDPWNILKHPLVFNYMNEWMLDSAILLFLNTCLQADSHIFLKSLLLLGIWEFTIPNRAGQ
uniref:Uncharacterized protein n=1 Tax=Panagrolaimus sp. PS1159 TaxID=55785 RepID=A0AC35GL66_9BILA